MLDKFTGVAKELGVSQENAQRLMDLAAENSSTVIEQQRAAWDKMRDGWVNEIKSDKDFGGGKFNETIERAKRTLKSYDTEGELGKFLEETGFGDHPGVIRVLARIDKAMSEDRTVDGKPGKPDTRSAAQVIYGN